MSSSTAAPEAHPGVAWGDDAFEVSLGSIDLRTAKIVRTFLFRGFIIQDILENAGLRLSRA